MTHVIYVNPAYEEIWGRSCEELYRNPRSWFQGIHPEDRDRLRLFFDKLQPIDGCEHTYRVIHPNGTVRWLLERGFPVHDSAGRFYRLVGIARDITQHRLLEKEVLAISEREQQRLGQDLHDDLCQQLVGIEFLSKALEQQLAGKAAEQEHHTPITFAAKAGEIAQLIRAAIGHTRVLARGLAPFGLQSDGLAKALAGLAARTSELFRIECAFDCAASPEIIDLSITTNLYRIAQEAVTNSIKHGKATRVKIALTKVVEGLRLSIEDNGSGFSSPRQLSTGMGLRIMQYRADMMAATFSLESSGQGGAVVVCSVPLGAAEQTAQPVQLARQPIA
jgi:PAS domain S-box-containing protein